MGHTTEPVDSLPDSHQNPESEPHPPHDDADPTPSDPDQTTQKEKLHEELEKQLDLKEVEVVEEEHEKEEGKKDSGEWKQDEHFKGGDSEGEEKENGNDNEEDEIEKVDGEVEVEMGDKNETSNGNRLQQYPVRPEAEDCAYYMKTGTCKFGSNCKFNHPVRRKNQVAKEKAKDREEATDKPSQTECKYYLRTGGCKFGKACRYNHSKGKTTGPPAKTPVSPVSEFNFLGLPIRPGEKECSYYMRSGSCKYGANCRFNHPDPTAVGGSDTPSAFANGGSASLHASTQPNVGSWSPPGALNEAASFVPIMFPPAHGLPSHNPEWNGYQAPVYPPETSMHPRSPYDISNPATEANVYAHQQQIMVDEYPERPGQPDCSYFLKTGACKFKSNCKFHHPKNRISNSPPCALSDKGLPLRPGQDVCAHYSRYGICKFGPACRYHHPIQQPGSGDAQSATFGYSATSEEARTTETGNGSGTAIQQQV